MAADLETLRKIIRLESQKGYLDTAVIGGFDRFLDNWIKQNLAKSSSVQKALLKKIASRKTRYTSMPQEEREHWIGQLEKIISESPRKKIPASPKPTQTEPSVKKAVRQGTITLNLQSPVTVLKGISTAYAQKLARLDVHTIKDLLFLFPNRHLDYSHLKTVSQLVEGQEETIIANIWEVRKVNIGGRPSTEAVLGDSTGNIRAVWFNNPYLVRQLAGTGQIVLSGRARFFNGRPVYESPDWELIDEGQDLIHAGRLVPVYPLTVAFTSVRWGKQSKAPSTSFPTPNEFLPSGVIERNDLLA